MAYDSEISRIRSGGVSGPCRASAIRARHAYSALAEIFIARLTPSVVRLGRAAHSWLLSSEWRPHSVLAWPAHRPARSSSPTPTGLVHGQQPIEGYPRSCRGL